MSRENKAATLTFSTLLLVVLLSGCSSTTSISGDGSGSGQTRALDCSKVKHGGAVVINMDADSASSLAKSLPESHIAEACKVKHSVVWYAHNGKDLEIQFEAEKSGRGHPKSTPDCRNYTAANGKPLAALCLVELSNASIKGENKYQVFVTTVKDGRKEIDPQLIIKE